VHKTKQGHYQTELKVKDEEFAEKFAKSSSKILSKNPNPNSVHKQGDYYRTQFSSRLFYFIEFLRGFFDSEGNPHIEAKNCFVVKIGAANTSLEILEYIRELLIEKIGIESRIIICNKAGSKTMINGKEITRKLSRFFPTYVLFFPLTLLKLYILTRFLGVSVVGKDRVFLCNP